jgi:hypothetical protein
MGNYQPPKTSAGRRLLWIQSIFFDHLHCVSPINFDCSETVDPVLRKLNEISRSHGFSVPAHCVMPDHLHALIEGLAENSGEYPYCGSDRYELADLVDVWR